MNMKSHSATRAGLSDPSALTVCDMVTSTLPFLVVAGAYFVARIVRQLC
jgi:hypothetical protein